jgi:hypothetical protein
MRGTKQTVKAMFVALALGFAVLAIAPPAAVAQMAVPEAPPAAVPEGGVGQPAPPPGAAPQPRMTLSPPSTLIGFGVMAVLLIVVVAISFIPSKRGHQD